MEIKSMRDFESPCARGNATVKRREDNRERCVGLGVRKKYRREKEGEGGQHNTQEEEEEEKEEGDEERQWQGQEEEDENPYVFHKHHFTSRVTTQHGRVAFLPKFTQRSKLLRGLEKYRLDILIANPQTFITPTHLDADVVFLR
ncbi:hypothetical protein WN944_013089 [Citrus x changshan-huyou]|uniref:Uncharacterized protein n=1 Tax=Citrus x changshan-huyou TaxID=2935761 RepID=A0AAP0M7A7_9ROSI